MNFTKYHKYQKYLLGTGLLFLLSTKQVFAALNLIESISLKAISTVISWGLYIIGYIAGFFVIVGGTLTNWAINLNSQILSDNLVKVGWVVSRDIANLGFVFFIILIAFATILQLQSYSMKKLLWKLVAAALLVNFSLVIAGVFLDFSGVLTDFFLSRATHGDLSKSGESLVNAIGVHRIFNQPESESIIKNKVAGISSDSNNYVNFIASLAFAVFFTVATATALFSFAAMFFMRYLSLIILLILAPLAWLMWVWPETAGQWNKWWAEFLKWVWFGPAASFFFYLSLSLALSFKEGGANFVTNQTLASVTDLNSTGLLIQGLGKMIAQMASVIGLMYYGLAVANSMGIAGANVGFAVAGKVKGFVTGAAGYGVSGAGAAAGLGYMAGNKLFGAGIRNKLEKFTSQYTGVPLVGGLVQSANIALNKSSKKSVEEHAEHYKAMGKEARLNAATSTFNILDADERDGLMSVIAGNPGEMEALEKKFRTTGTKLGLDGKPAFIDNAAEAKWIALKTSAANGPKGKEALAADPTLANYIKRDDGASDEQHAEKIAKTLAKAIASATADAIKNMKIETLISGDNIANLRTHHLNAILERGFDDIEKFIEEMTRRLEGFKDKDQGKLTVAEKSILSLAKTINGKHSAWSGYQISEKLMERFSNEKKGKERREEGEEPEKSFEPVSGINLKNK